MAKLALETGKSNKILRTESRAVSDFSDPDLRKLIAEMEETLRLTENAAGLAAPQVGKNLRLFVIIPELPAKGARLPDGQESAPGKKAPTVFINAEIVKKSQKELRLAEGCLSLPGLFGIVKRAKWVKVQAQDELGKKFKLKAEGFLSQLIQHEIDHLNGKLYVDRAEKMFKIEDDKIKEL